MLIESDNNNNKDLQSEKKTKELQHTGPKKQIEEPTLEVEKVTTTV